MPSCEHSPELTDLLTPVLQHARAELAALPLVPEIQLFLLNGDYPQESLSRDEIERIMRYPAYWCFCWASGQVLSRYILDHPDLVAGKRVLDFGCGSGVVAIAAAMAGAREVVACDIDTDALRATEMNAHCNGVTLHYSDDFFSYSQDIDVLLVADVLYDRANLPLLETFLQKAPRVLVADSRVKNFHFPHYSHLHSHRADTVPDLAESEEFSHVNLYIGQRG